MTNQVAETLETLSREGTDPGADAMWQRAVDRARPRRRRRLAAMVAPVLVVAIVVTVAVVSSTNDQTTSVRVPATRPSSTDVGTADTIDPSAAGLVLTLGSGPDWVIARVEASGALRPLSTPGCCSSAAWSPDHLRIAFVQDGSLAVMNRFGSDVHRLGQATAFPPAWSPDGTQLAFSASPPPPSSNGGPLKVVNADGTGLRTVVEMFAGAPTWSSSGEIVVTNLQEPLTLTRVDVASGATTTFLAPGVEQSWPAWSPDGQDLAFSVSDPEPGKSGIYTVDSTFTRQLTDGRGDVGATWSPDGRRIAFTRTVAGVRQLFVVKVATGKVTQLTFGADDVSSASW